MFYFKGCPRCRGDLYANTDIYGPYTACLQCGHYLTREEEKELESTGPLWEAWAAALVQQEKAAA